VWVFSLFRRITKLTPQLCGFWENPCFSVYHFHLQALESISFVCQASVDAESVGNCPFCQRLSALHDEAVKEAVSARLLFSFASFPSCFLRAVMTSCSISSVRITFLWLFNITCSFLPFSFPFSLSLSLSCRNQMGNLLKVLTCTELEQGPNFFLDFESEHSLCLPFCYTPSPTPSCSLVIPGHSLAGQGSAHS